MNRDTVTGKFVEGRIPASERFWPKVNKAGPTPSERPDLGPCWLWTGATYPAGYGQFSIAPSKPTYAHRFAFGATKGQVIDHLCRNRLCVNPVHMEAVTHKINILRGVGASARNAKVTHCPKGHPYDEVNTYHYRGQRQCRACQRIRNQRRRESYGRA